jgi:hypothetical protein
MEENELDFNFEAPEAQIMFYRDDEDIEHIADKNVVSAVKYAIVDLLSRLECATFTSHEDQQDFIGWLKKRLVYK